MRILEIDEIERTLDDAEVIDLMSAALLAHSRGECQTPMPMHLEITPEEGEVHMKSSYRLGGQYFALKTATGFPNNPARGLPVGSGMMLLSSAETGRPVALLADGGHLTDVRTAAVGAAVTKALGRQDRQIGILGTGIQARLQTRMHTRVLPLETVHVWGRSADRVEAFRRDVTQAHPEIEVVTAQSPAEVAQRARLIVTVTAARGSLLRSEGRSVRHAHCGRRRGLGGQTRIGSGHPPSRRYPAR